MDKRNALVVVRHVARFEGRGLRVISEREGAIFKGDANTMLIFGRRRSQAKKNRKKERRRRSIRYLGLKITIRVEDCERLLRIMRGREEGL